MDLLLFVDAATGKHVGGQGIVVKSEDPTGIYFSLRLPLHARMNQMRAEMSVIWTGLGMLPDVLSSFGVDPMSVYLHVYTDSKAAIDALYRPDTQTNKKVRLLIKRIWKRVNFYIAQPKGGGCTFYVISRKEQKEDSSRTQELRRHMTRAHELSRKARAAFKDV